jgi:hypothetical protein
MSFDDVNEGWCPRCGETGETARRNASGCWHEFHGGSPHTKVMTYAEYLNLVATAMIEQEDFGHMRSETKALVMAIRDGDITVLDEGEVRPLKSLGE